MTSLDVTAPIAVQSSKNESASKGYSLPLWLLIGLALVSGLILSATGVRGVWQHSTFVDADDAMRLVQVRELLAGQPWFDMTIGRLDPPPGVFMHWSRIVDIPLAVSIKFFSAFLPVDVAERLTRLLFPLTLQALLYFAVARLARLLMGVEAVLPAVVITLFSGIVFGQFQPGRIDHHAPQIVLLLFMLANLVDSVDAARARRAAMTGALAAFSLAISIENVPFILVFVGLTVALWIAHGAPMRKALASFGIGLVLALPLVFVATVGRAHWFDMACDAYSPAYLLPGFASAVMMIALATASTRLQTPFIRLLAAGLAGTLVVTVVLITKPICFLDPFHGIDPLVREIWLKNVQEAMPFTSFFHEEPFGATIFLLPIILGFGAATAAAWFETGAARTRWLIVSIVSGVGILLSCWMIRVIGFAGPIALLGGTWCIVKLHDSLTRAGRPVSATLAFMLILPFSTVGWALILPADSRAAADKQRSDCLASSAFAPLAQLPPGIIAAPIDAGSHLLVFTLHSVLAGPYHRDNQGVRATLDAFMAEPSIAHDILRANNVTYVMTCAGLKETAALAKRAPQGLAAALEANRVKAWLQRLSIKGPYQVFVMRP